MAIKENIRQQIVYEYLNYDLNLPDLAKKYKIAKTSVGNILKENKVTIINRHRKITNLNKIQIKEFIDVYNKGEGINYCLKKFHLSYNKARNILTENNIHLRNYRESIPVKNRKIYFVKEDFFDNPEQWNEEQAWTLGWWASDGNNYTPKYSIFIKLQERDKEILNTIKIFLQYTGPMIYKNLNTINPNHSNTWCLQIRNQKLSKKLYELGVVDKKSLIYTFPKFLKSDLLRHFMRGYWEGDGHITNIYSKGKLVFWNLIGTMNFLIDYNKILNEQIKIKLKNIKYKGKNYNGITSHFNISNKIELYKLYLFFYKDSKYFLSRKKERFDNFVKYIQSVSTYNYLNPQIV